jgi:uncharacterized RDD family membrane protein YckC
MSTRHIQGAVAAVEEALADRRPTDDVLDLADEAIEHASGLGDSASLTRLADVLADAATARGAHGLAVVARRARATAAGLEPAAAGVPEPAAEARLSAPAVRYAGWWTRALAFMADWFVLLMVVGVVPTESAVAVFLVVVMLPVAYFAGLHAFADGQTIGKKTLGIAVRSDNGDGIDLGRALTRSVVQYLLWLTVVGGIVDSLVPLADSRKRALHDRAAGTIVVRVR